MQSQLDTTYQQQLLERLAEAYPDDLDPEELEEEDRFDQRLNANVRYLAEHGLVDADEAEFLGCPTTFTAVRITARGLDFLQEDGGLTAALGVVTIRFDPETLRALIARELEASTLPAKEKSVIRSMLSSAGDEALRRTTTTLVEAALQQAPRVWSAVQTLLGPQG